MSSKRKIGVCLCGNPGIKRSKSGDVCARCWQIESSTRTNELMRGVCGYRRRGVLAAGLVRV